MQSTAKTVDEYMETVPPERLAALTKLRELCLTILDGYEESMLYGMPAYSKDGGGVAFNSQKNYISFYVQAEVADQYRDQLKNCGKTCIRYTNPNQIDFNLVEKMLESTVNSAGEVRS